MRPKRLIKNARRLARRYQVTSGRGFRLKDVDPGDTLSFSADDKARAKKSLQQGVQALAAMQDRLYAQDRWALLLIFQAMDAAGKDGAIKHVMSGVNPQGCQVYSFKAPSAEDLDHDYLWRCAKCLPERGRIGIFNRSYYEETLVVRVHPEILERQHLPPELVRRSIWKQRYHEIRNFEQYLTGNGIAIRKFFLHVSRGEQRKRFLAAHRRSGEELEVFCGRRAGTAPLARVHGRPTRTPSVRPRRPKPRGTSSPPTTSGSRGWSSRRPWSRRSTRWICTIPA